MRCCRWWTLERVEGLHVGVWNLLWTSWSSLSQQVPILVPILNPVSTSSSILAPHSISRSSISPSLAPYPNWSAKLVPVFSQTWTPGQIPFSSLASLPSHSLIPIAMCAHSSLPFILAPHLISLLLPPGNCFSGPAPSLPLPACSLLAKPIPLPSPSSKPSFHLLVPIPILPRLLTLTCCFSFLTPLHLN